MKTLCDWTRQTLIGGNCHVPPFIFNDVRVITREPSKPWVLGYICVSSCSDECDQGQWHLLNKISSTYTRTCICTNWHTDIKNTRPKFFTAVDRQWLSITFAIDCWSVFPDVPLIPRIHAFMTDMGVRTNTQPLWHMLNKTLSHGKPILPTYAEHSMSSMLHCTALWHSVGLSFNLETITQVRAQWGMTFFLTNRNHMDFCQCWCFCQCWYCFLFFFYKDPVWHTHVR